MMQIKNNKGATLMIWIELMLFLILFLTVMGLIGADLNSDYGTSNDLTLGLNLSKQQSDLYSYKNDIINDTTQGQSSMTDFGILKLLTVPKILLNVATIAWSFVNGSFIFHLVNAMNLGIYGYYLAITFQVLYVIGIGFIIIKLVLRMPA